MSYTEHFGLTAAPFQLTPDPRFWFESATHKRAMAYLGYGLQQAEGFIVVTGEVGSGKTTLVGLLMQRLDPARVQAVRIVSTQVDGDDMLRLVSQAFGVPTEGIAKAQLLDRVERYLSDRAREGRKMLLVVDEAQNLSTSALEELRMLSNFSLGERSLMQILLLGQPEFRERLASPALEQLRQRVIATHHLDAMDAAEARSYLEHRLAVVGWHGLPHFTDDACAKLHQASAGIPRRMNQLAMRSLLMVALDRGETIDGAMVDAVVADFGADQVVPEIAEPRPEHAPKAQGFRSPAFVGDRGADAKSTPDPRIADYAARIESLETQIIEQEAALRRVLTLLIDWVEREEAASPNFARAQPA